MMRFLSVLIWVIALAGSVLAQQTAAPPAFEVADIKPSDPSARMPGKGRMLPGGRIEVPTITLRELIVFAYGVQENMISGGPKWAGSDRFDLVAKAPENTPMSAMQSMMQTLLAERFKLVFHREEKVMPAYVLTVGKREPKYHEGSGGRQTCNWTRLDSGLMRRECQNMTMPELARQLPGWGAIGINLPVVDETGLKGAYDFHLDVGMGRPQGSPMGPGPGEGGGPRREEGRGGGLPDAAAADSGPTIFAALEQIGLKLESRKMPLSMIVIDGAERPVN